MTRQQMIEWLIRYNKDNSYFGEENEMEYILALTCSTDDELRNDVESKQ